MRALDRKLLRDVARMQGQVVTIALVVACGIASYVAIEGTHRSLLLARDAYYERGRFPDVFAHVKSAPETLRERIEQIPGIAFADTRVVAPVSALLPGEPEPIKLQLHSLPERGGLRLGAITLRDGRMPEPGRAGEAVVLEAFARAHGLEVGDRLPVVMAGIASELVLVGIALAPEYVFAIAPGEIMHDPRRFGVLWMNRAVVSAAFDMQGSFNDVIGRLQPGASEPAVLLQLDRLLAPYGAVGAYGRDRQPSNNVLRAEVAQLEMLTRMMPTIFLGVAAFLINVVLSRLVHLQRAQVAVLKAIGYRDRQVGLHYLELVCLIGMAGSLLGVAVGWWTGTALTGLLTQYFHFPSFGYRLSARVVATAVAISLLAAVVGALSAVRRVTRLPAAEAMRPEQPASYRAGMAAWVRHALGLGQASTMVLRELERRPLRALLSSAGIAMGVAILVSGRFGVDAVGWFLSVQFELAQREDVSVTFREPEPRAALHELRHLPGVLASEGLRMTGVRYRARHHSREGVLLGHPEHADLRRVIDARGHLVALPERGVLLSSTLGSILELKVGDSLEVQPLEGARRTERLVVGAFIDDVLGLFGHLPAAALDRLLREEGRISQALLRVDPLLYDALMAALRARPGVLSVARHDAVTDQFQKQTAGQMRVTTLILTVFAMIIASGVVYNNARIALSARSRDLASLRVLGFRRREISAVLLGELGVHVVVALLPGLYAGRVLCGLMMAARDREMYRFPLVISPHTHAFAVVVTLLASLASALLVRRRLDRLDLISVLKSRE